MSGSTNKSPIKLNVAEIKLTQWRKPTWQKPHRLILRSPLPRIHYYHNKWLQVKESQYLIPTYSWTLIPIPKWTYFIVTISPFQYTAPSMWLTNRCTDSNTRLNHQLEKGVGYKVLQFIQTMKIKKLLGHKTLQCTNTTASSRERRTRANSVSDHNLHEQDFALYLCNCATFDGPQNNLYICLGLWEKKT